ncbi:hypothetical protein B0H13DRAFT_1880511 [Mycena leptocephala]|nr:hypothetical protein B0H13DRAFT_1880511 [Mycena leptocephala]
MDFVATSQPCQDGEELGFQDSMEMSLELDTADIIGSSQPFEDGEEDLVLLSGVQTLLPPETQRSLRISAPNVRLGVDSEMSSDPPPSDILARRARLVRRAPPVFISESQPELELGAEHKLAAPESSATRDYGRRDGEKKEARTR